MEDPFVTDICFQDQHCPVECGGDALSALSFEMHPSRQALMQGSSSWERSVHNLRYGLSPHEMPEDSMAYQGPAQHKKENDRAMTVHYQNYQQERRRAERVQRKLEEKHAELERQKRQAEQVEAERQTSAEIMARSRQTAFLLAKQQEQLQQQQAIFNRQYPQYGFLAPMETGSPDLGVSVPAMQFAYQRRLHQTAPATSSRQTSHVRLAQQLDQSITNSPTYRSSPALTFRTPARRSQSKATRVQAQTNSISVDLDGYDIPIPRPSGMIKLPQSVSDQQNHARAAAYTPAPSADSPDPDSDLIEVKHRTQRQKTSIMIAATGAKPTPPVSANSGDDDAVFSDSPRTEGLCNLGERPASPSLSEIIGSETPSEADDDDGDGDEDFDPRKRGARLKVPKHNEVKSIGMKKRRSSGRTRQW